MIARLRLDCSNRPFTRNIILCAHLAHRPVGLEEVGFEEQIKQISGNPLNGVIEGKNMDPLAILDVSALRMDDGDR